MVLQESFQRPADETDRLSCMCRLICVCVCVYFADIWVGAFLLHLYVWWECRHIVNVVVFQYCVCLLCILVWYRVTLYLQFDTFTFLWRFLLFSIILAGVWMSYSFGENSAGVATGIVEPDPWTDSLSDKWVSVSVFFFEGNRRDGFVCFFDGLEGGFFLFQLVIVFLFLFFLTGIYRQWELLKFSMQVSTTRK